MDINTLLPAILIIVGAGFMLASILVTLKIREKVPEEVKGKWNISMGLMFFFLLGYIVTLVILLTEMNIPIAILTGAIFLGGGMFVNIIITLFKLTLNTIEEKEADLWLSKEKLRRKMEEEG